MADDCEEVRKSAVMNITDKFNAVRHLIYSALDEAAEFLENDQPPQSRRALDELKHNQDRVKDRVVDVWKIDAIRKSLEACHVNITEVKMISLSNEENRIQSPVVDADEGQGGYVRKWLMEKLNLDLETETDTESSQESDLEDDISLLLEKLKKPYVETETESDTDTETETVCKTETETETETHDVQENRQEGEIPDYVMKRVYERGIEIEGDLYFKFNEVLEWMTRTQKAQETMLSACENINRYLSGLVSGGNEYAIIMKVLLDSEYPKIERMDSTEKEALTESEKGITASIGVQMDKLIHLFCEQILRLTYIKHESRDALGLFHNIKGCLQARTEIESIVEQLKQISI